MGILAKQISLHQYQKVKKKRIEREIPKSFGLSAYPKGKKPPLDFITAQVAKPNQKVPNNF